VSLVRGSEKQSDYWRSVGEKAIRDLEEAGNPIDASRYVHYLLFSHLKFCNQKTKKS
jgi:biotin operon repressor